MGQGGAKITRVDITDVIDPRVTGRAAQKGTLYRYIPAVGNPEVLIKADDGYTTNWVTMSGGSSGPLTTVTAAAPANIDVANPPADLDGGFGGTVGDLWLLPNQTLPEENGVYIFNGAAVPLTRAVGWDEAGEFVPGRQVFVDEGATLGNTLWVNEDPVTVLGVDPISFQQAALGSFMLRDFSNVLPAANAVNMGGFPITNVLDPANPQEAATKAYVDALAVTASGALGAIQLSNGAGVFIDDGARLFWDTVNFLLGVGTNVPTEAVDVVTANNNYGILHRIAGVGAEAVATFIGSGKCWIGTKTAFDLSFFTAGGNEIATFVDTSQRFRVDTGLLVSRSASVNTTAVVSSMALCGTGSDVTTVTASGAASIAAGDGGGSVVASGVASLAHGQAAVGSITASAAGAEANGNTLTGATPTILSSGPGAKAFGECENDGIITSSSRGSLAHGKGNAGGEVRASEEGASAHGRATDAGTIIVASAIGTHAHGVAGAASTIAASSAGSLAHGQALSASSITASGAGSAAFGQAEDAGLLTASGIGALVHGRHNAAAGTMLASGVGATVAGRSSGDMTASGDGSQARGVKGTGTFTAVAEGSLVQGFVNEATMTAAAGAFGAIVFGTAVTSAVISASGAGSMAFGSSSGAGSDNIASGVGSIAGGESTGGGSIAASGTGSFAMGITGGGGITASGPGSYAFGWLGSGSILASAQGSGAIGRVSGGAAVQATADGAQAQGNADTDNITASGIGSFAFGSTAAGGAVIASGEAALAGGRPSTRTTQATTTNALAYGDGNQVSGVNASALGQGHTVASFAAVAIGRFASITGTVGAWVATEAAFVIGNGTAVGAEADGFRVDKDGKVIETGANRVPVRIVTGNDTLSARTDRKIIKNGGVGAFAVALPAGEDGLTFEFAPTSTDAGTWTLTPNGGDVVEANLASAFGNAAAISNSMVYLGGTWYLG